MARPCPLPPQRRQLLIVGISKMFLVITFLFVLKTISRWISLLQESFHTPTAIKLKLIELARRSLRHKPVSLLSERELLLSHVTGECARSSGLKNARQDCCKDDKRGKRVWVDVRSCIGLFLISGAVTSIPPFPIFPGGVAEGTVVKSWTLAVLLTSRRGRRVAAGVSRSGRLS